jgi:hypothetical protein
VARRRIVKPSQTISAALVDARCLDTLYVLLDTAAASANERRERAQQTLLRPRLQD